LLLTAIVDLAATVAAYYTTFFIRFHSNWGGHFFAWFNNLIERRIPGLEVDYRAFYATSGPRIILFIGVTLLVLYGFLDLYAGSRRLRRRSYALDILKANALALALFYGYFYLSRNQFHPRSMFVTVLFFNTLYTLFARGELQEFLRRVAAFGQPAVMVGTGREPDELAAWLDDARPGGVRVVRRLPWTPGTPVESLLDQLGAAVRETGARLVICADRRLPLPQAMEVVEKADDWGVSAKILSDEMNVLPHRAHVPMDTFFDGTLVHFAGGSERRWPLAVRRAVSVVLALALAVVALPFMALIALLVAVTSPGPVFFIQERIGVNRRPFRMVKFRTMHNRADEVQAQLEELNESGEGLFKVRRDPRVTPVGRFLRRFSLDELPQLWNVLRGEMLLVGPRPLPRRDFENYYEQWHYQRHGGLPGLTCLWQVSGRSDIAFHNMCILDVYYLENASLWLDLRILLRTVGVVLFAKGAY
jgi:exopolysaccharide biosynthesis polyprenyl glycosylphosphotransferase